MGIERCRCLTENQGFYQKGNKVSKSALSINKNSLALVKKYGTVTEFSWSDCSKNKRASLTAKKFVGTKYELQPGDIVGFCSISQMSVYAGKNSKGQMVWYDAGRGGDGKYNGKQKYIFNSFGPVRITANENASIRYIVRLK